MPIGYFRTLFVKYIEIFSHILALHSTGVSRFRFVERTPTSNDSQSYRARCIYTTSRIHT